MLFAVLPAPTFQVGSTVRKPKHKELGRGTIIKEGKQPGTWHVEWEGRQQQQRERATKEDQLEVW
jgi:hypothetical protein